MKAPQLIILIIILCCVLSAAGQDAVKRRLPLVVSHLSEENKALLRRKAAPKHYILSKVICFNRVCRGFIGWRKRQRGMRFKGYKDGGKVPRPRKPDPVIPVAPIVKDTVTVRLPSAPVIADTTIAVRQQVFILDEVLFEVNSTRLNEKFTYRMDSLVKLLSENERLSAQISGHTDNTGSESFNLRLSEERAASVAEYLITKKISITRISYDGYGSSKPIDSNLTEAGRRKNRRVEIVVSEE
jgi:outer membrane protein OmpA-like peptidoglycan-associated protein